jgi:CRP-like cAMP-binding protein
MYVVLTTFVERAVNGIMENADVDFLAQTSLFTGANKDEIAAMLSCLDARYRAYDKDEVIYHTGDTISSLGLVVSGSVRIENTDVWGNISIVGQIAEGAVFAETYAAVKSPLMVDAIAAADCEILFLNVSRILTTCSHACAHHQRTTSNLLAITARKNLSLTNRIFHTAPKTIRARVLAYLSTQAELAGSSSFDIPFNRQQLAEYLGVDRSALSNELSKMRDAGIIETHRSHFVLLGATQTWE